MSDLDRVIAAAYEAIQYAQHLFGCEVDQTDVCTCGMAASKRQFNKIVREARESAHSPK